MRKIELINEGWLFGLCTELNNDVPKAESLKPVNIPHVWNIDNPQEQGPRVYIKTLVLNASFKQEKRCYISFGAVAGVCKAWMNGKFLGEHRGGYSKFRFDITEAVIDGVNQLVVLADNTRYDNIIPLGGDFNNYGGIYRDVELITVPHTHFDLMYYGSPGVELDAFGDGRLRLIPHVVGANDRCRVTYTIIDNGKSIISKHFGAFETAEIQITEPHLWNGVDDPYLYTLKASLHCDDECIDEISLPFGFRGIAITPGRGFFLNGKHMALHGVAMHQDREGVACGTTKEMLEEDIALIKETGANAIRLSHYQHPDYIYSLCDREGFVVWAEIPLLGLPDNNDALFENAKSQMMELILQCKHHPSICFWGVQNEIAMFGETVQMYSKIEKLNALVKEMDLDGISVSANLSTVKNNSQLNFITDMVGYNSYFGWYDGEMEDYEAFFDRFHEDNPQVCFGLSEYGVDCLVTLHSSTPKRKDYSEEFQALFHETVYPMVEKRPYMWGSFIWNMFDFGSAVRDEGGVKGRNNKGLVTYDRKIKKDSFYFYKACWSKEPFVWISGRRYAKRSGDYTEVKVYSNAKAVKLFVNGRLIECINGERVFLFKNVPLSDGKNIIKAISGELSDEMVITKVDEPEKSYIYIDPNPGFNVKNWFTPGQSEEQLFPKDSYSIMDSISELMENEEARALLEQNIPQVINNPRAKVMVKITLLRAINFMSGQFEEEFIKELNRKLNRIKKK